MRARINNTLPRIKSTTAHNSDTATDAETAAMQELSALIMYATKQERNNMCLKIRIHLSLGIAMGSHAQRAAIETAICAS